MIPLGRAFRNRQKVSDTIKLLFLLSCGGVGIFGDCAAGGSKEINVLLCIMPVLSTNISPTNTPDKILPAVYFFVIVEKSEAFAESLR